MNIHIKRRSLTDLEITELIQDYRLFPHAPYVSRARWRRFSDPYIIEVESKFVGICVVYKFGQWIKLGPLGILNKYQGKGLGKYLLRKIINDHKNTSIFIASSNPSVKHIIESFGFEIKPNFLSLPKELKFFLFKQIFEHLNFSFFIEGIRKKFFLLRKDVKYYIKTS